MEPAGTEHVPYIQEEEKKSVLDRKGKIPDPTLTSAMSQTVTSSQVAARSKLCTLFFTLRAILQSPQPKSATTREGGLQDEMCTTLNITQEGTLPAWRTPKFNYEN